MEGWGDVGEGGGGLHGAAGTGGVLVRYAAVREEKVVVESV